MQLHQETLLMPLPRPCRRKVNEKVSAVPGAGCMPQLAMHSQFQSILMLSGHARLTLPTDHCVDGIALPCGTLQVPAGKAMEL